MKFLTWMNFLVAGQFSPEENCPWSGLEFEWRLELVLGLGATRHLPPRKFALWLGVGVGLGLVFGLGAIFLGVNCPRTEFGRISYINTIS